MRVRGRVSRTVGAFVHHAPRRSWRTCRRKWPHAGSACAISWHSTWLSCGLWSATRRMRKIRVLPLCLSHLSSFPRTRTQTLTAMWTLNGAIGQARCAYLYWRLMCARCRRDYFISFKHQFFINDDVEVLGVRCCVRRFLRSAHAHGRRTAQFMGLSCGLQHVERMTGEEVAQASSYLPQAVVPILHSAASLWFSPARAHCSRTCALARLDRGRCSTAPYRDNRCGRSSLIASRHQSVPCSFRSRRSRSCAFDFCISSPRKAHQAHRGSPWAGQAVIGGWTGHAKRLLNARNTLSSRAAICTEVDGRVNAHERGHEHCLRWSAPHRCDGQSREDAARHE
jgi:hypothetical protein